MRSFRSRPAIALVGITVSLSCFLNAIPHVALAEQAPVSNRGGFPGRRVGGGSRSNCSIKTPLVALSPKTNFGKTTVAYPTLYFSTPSANKSLKLKFSLKDEAGATLAKHEFVMEQKSGIIGIDLSKVIQTPLKINQIYHWYFSATCVAQESGQTPPVEGWIQRVESDAQTAPLEKNSLNPELIRQAWKSGLWYDAIAALVQGQQSQPRSQPIAALWKEILQSEDLKEVMTETSLTVVSGIPSR